LQAYSAASKSAQDTMRAFQQFLGPRVTPGIVYTDGSKEFEKAMEDLGFSHDTSTPYRPQTNGVAERAVRRVKEGTTAVLLQSCFALLWWPEAMACYCFLRNVADKLQDGFTAYQNRYHRKFKGKLVPFGAAVSYKPSSPKDLDRLPKFGDKTLPGLFVGYHLHAGGSWSGDYLVVDLEELGEAEAARDVHIKRIKELDIPLGKWSFPLADGTAQQPGANQRRQLRPTRQIWESENAGVTIRKAGMLEGTPAGFCRSRKMGMTQTTRISGLSQGTR
jgi:hypothetical protein